MSNRLKIPGRYNALVPFVQDIIEECTASLPKRLDMYRYFRAYYYTGAADGTTSKHNKCYSHIDKLSSLLFSAYDVKFDVTFDGDEIGEAAGMGESAARYLTREYYRSKSGLAFSQGVDVSLVEGCAFIKKVQTHHGPSSFVVRPGFMGVMREDINDLDEQDAFIHSYYVTPRQFKRLIANKPEGEQARLVEEVKATATKPSQAEYEDSSYFHEIVMGGLQPITGPGLPQGTGGRGSVSPYTTPSPMLAAEVAASLIRIDDIWIMDDEREDWTTIRYCGPGTILQGDIKHENLSGIPKEQPFTKICPNEQPGYFWGTPELASVTGLQALISARMNDFDTIIKRQTRPSRVFTGFNNINPERAAALMSLDGMMTDDTPTGKIETLAPEMPPDLLNWMGFLNECFDDQAGITAIMQGQGEAGVRAGVHANALLRTSTPRLRDRAMLVESQVAEDADKTLKMLQAKNADVHISADGKQFLLSQLPDDAMVVVDSHSSSPAFSGDQAQMAFNLKRFGAIDDIDLLDMIPGLPRAGELKIKARKRAEAQQKLIEAHPELLQHGKGGGKR